MGINEYIQIGAKIKEARSKSGFTQKEMAQKLHISISTYSNYENGYREPPLKTIESICEILGYSLDDLIGYKPNQASFPLGVKAHSIQDFKNLKKIFESPIPSATDKEIIQEYISMGEEPQELTAYFSSNEYTPEELEEIKKYAEFLKSRRDTEYKK